jgi:peptidoglycan/LPS O-acetylase OafA/YrhL
MGILRFLFAISVVGAHTWPGTMLFVGGRNAVQCFFIISGFIITFILVDSKKYTISQFYASRLIRLFPTYFFILISTFLLYKFSGFTSDISANFINVFSNLSINAKLLLILSNITLLGQDIIMFMSLKNGELGFTSNFNNSDLLLYHGLLVPQAWTISLEIYFYLLAPLIVKRYIYLLSILFLSVICRFYLFKEGLALQDPWIYRFFPAELFFFLMGSISYLIIYKKIVIRSKILFNIKTSTILVLILLFYCIFYSYIPFKEIIKTFLLFILLIFIVPFSYIFNNKFKYDMIIGELSYPIYISHFMVMFLISLLQIQNSYIYSMVTIFVTILLSILIMLLIESPLKSFKYKYFESINKSR